MFFLNFEEGKIKVFKVKGGINPLHPPPWTSMDTGIRVSVPENNATFSLFSISIKLLCY